MQFVCNVSALIQTLFFEYLAIICLSLPYHNKSAFPAKTNFATKNQKSKDININIIDEDASAEASKVKANVNLMNRMASLILQSQLYIHK